MAGKCIVEGCNRAADKVIGVRLRRELDQRSAIWAPDAAAHVCDDHAELAFDIDVRLVPRQDKTLHITVSCGDKVSKTRLWDITKPVNPDDK